MKNFIKKIMVMAGFSFLALTGTANAEVSAETAYVFNTFSFLVSGSRNADGFRIYLS